MKKGDKVHLEGVIENIIDHAYAEVRIRDGICGANIVRLTVHRNVIKGIKKSKRKLKVQSEFEIREKQARQYVMFKSTQPR
jgi:hypothetical protein